MQLVDVVLTGMMFLVNLGRLVMSRTARERGGTTYLDPRGQAVFTITLGFLFLANLIQHPPWLHMTLLGLTGVGLVVHTWLWWRTFSSS